MTRPFADRLGPWLDRPVPRPVLFATTAILLLVPSWIMADSLEYYFLKLDDFVFIADSRTFAMTLTHLFTPHNVHVVPLFRLLTYVLIRVSGGLAALPPTFGIATSIALGLTMLGVKRLVDRETRRPALGLIAMAMIGLSTVIEPAVIWYSAGQALWAALVVVAMLLALQTYREVGRSVWLIGGAILALAAPAVWSGGYVAGPAGAVYLWVSHVPGRRKVAMAPLVASLAFAAMTLGQGGVAMVGDNPQGPRLTVAGRAVKGLLHTGQAIPECLGLANLGMDAKTTPSQGAVLTLILIGVWGWPRNGAGPRPLETAGAAMIVVGFGLAYVLRANWVFESLRNLGWYHTIPQVGAVILVCDWAARGREQGAVGHLSSITGRGLLMVLLVSVALAIVHLPRAERLFLAEVPPLSGSERMRFPVPALQRARGRVLAEERASRQRRFLTRLDRAGRLAVSLGTSREGVRSVLGPRIGPGFPDRLVRFDAADLLPIPVSGGVADPARIKAHLDEPMTVESEPRPPWLDPRDPWPPS